MPGVSPGDALPLMRAVKAQFDPKGNPESRTLRGWHFECQAFDSAPSARARADRSMRALRILPAGLSDVRAVGQRNGFAARPHLPNEDGQRRRDRHDRSVGPSTLDTCLGCMSCMTACPSGVDYAKLIEATRAQIERRHPRLAERLHRWMIFNTFPRVDRLRLLRPFLRAYQKSGLQALVRGSGLLKLLPKKLSAMEALMPTLAERRSHSSRNSGAGAETQARRPAVGMRPARIHAGDQRGHRSGACSRRLRSDRAADQPCCGALMVHAGEEAPALELARRMIDVFERAAGRRHHHQRRRLWIERARVRLPVARRSSVCRARGAVSAKCKDISEFLEELGPRADESR